MKNINVGTINGGNNQFNQDNRRYSVKNVHHGGSNNKNSDDPAGEGFAIIIAVFGAVTAAAFVYLRYFQQIFFWLELGELSASILCLAALIPQWRAPNLRYMKHTAFGVLLAFSQIWVTTLALDAMPSQVLDIANQPLLAKDFFGQIYEMWNRFNNDAHRLIIENMMSALFLAPAIVLNLLYALQNLLASLAYSEQSKVCATLARWLLLCKTWGAPLSALFTLGAYLAISGFLSVHMA